MFLLTVSEWLGPGEKMNMQFHANLCYETTNSKTIV